jgi:DNA-binding transcriptional regulator YhcF (GntR family)
MPISIDRFETDEELHEATTSERIIRFLFTHDEQAFTRQELADAIAVDPNTVGTNLSRLKKRELVRHRPPYWAVADDRERVLSAFKTHYETMHLNELLGEEHWEDWKEHAATDDETEAARAELDAE